MRLLSLGLAMTAGERHCERSVAVSARKRQEKF